MARWYLIVMAIALFVCLSQSAPAQDDSSANKLQEEVNKALDALKNTFESIAKDPKVQDLLKQGKEFVQSVQDGAGKLIPQTDSTAAA